MHELVSRLRREGENAMRRNLSLGMHALCAEAADEIERLSALLATAYDGLLNHHLHSDHERDDITTKVASGLTPEKMRQIAFGFDDSAVNK